MLPDIQERAIRANIGEVERSIDLALESGDSEAAADYIWEFGKCLLLFGQPEDKALEWFARALEMRPCTKFSIEYAELLSDLERHEDAAEVLLVNGELPTELDELRALLPITFRLAQERPDDSIWSDLNRAVEKKCRENDPGSSL